LLHPFRFVFRWLSDEFRHKIFPFELNKEFQLAIAIGSSCFKVAVDGRHLLNYDFKIVRKQMPKAFTGHHHIFDKLTGFKMFALKGMKLHVSFVDHIQAKSDLTFYEIFSNPSYGK
jgi:Galactoside-binding lectin